MVKCKNSAEVCQRNSDQNRDGLCGVCHRVTERILQNRDARGQMLNDRRNMDVNNGVEVPEATASVDLPPIDMAKMSHLYQQVIDGEEVSSNDLMTSVYCTYGRIENFLSDHCFEGNNKFISKSISIKNNMPVT